MRLTALCAAAALSSLAGLLTPAAALAAPHGHGHQATHPAAHPGKHAGKATPSAHAKHDHLTGLRKGTTADIAAQTRKVTRLLTDENARPGLNPADKAALAAATTNALTALGADAAAVPTAATAKDLHALAQAAVRTAQVAHAQYVVVLAADQLESDSAALAQGATALQAQVATASQGGTDTTALTAALTDLTTQLATVDSGASGVVTAVLALAPTASHADLVSAEHSAHTALAAGQTALKAAKADADTVTTALGG